MALPDLSSLESLVRQHLAHLGPTTVQQHALPFLISVVQTTLFTMSLLVIPVLLQLNGIYHKGYLFLALLGASVVLTTDDATTSRPSIVLRTMQQLIAGVIAGRWMHHYFPDDPTIDTLMGKR